MVPLLLRRRVGVRRCEICCQTVAIFVCLPDTPSNADTMATSDKPLNESANHQRHGLFSFQVDGRHDDGRADYVHEEECAAELCNHLP